MKRVLACILCLLCAVSVFAMKKQIKVEVPKGTEDRAYTGQGGGLIGVAVGERTRDVVFMLNVIVDGEHARLKCYESHKGCSPLGPGIYDAEQDKDSLWVSQTLPMTHKIVRDHWKVVGSW